MKRPFIDDETREASHGPLSIDVEMARAHGWSEKSILACYAILCRESNMRGAAGERAHPDRFEVLECGTKAFKIDEIDKRMSPIDDRVFYSMEMKKVRRRNPRSGVQGKLLPGRLDAAPLPAPKQ